VKSRILGVIPARLGSSRLPNKPLVPLLGRPLIEWVWRRVAGMRVLDEVVVATDSEAIAEVCREIGAPVVLTSPDHPSGTDRVAEVARMPAYAHFDVVVNIQGDEPLVEEDHLERAIALVREDGWPIGTCAAPLRDPESMNDPSVVKVVRAADGRALYFSRAAVPFDRDGAASGSGEGLGLGHIGIYACAREALVAWVALAPSPLEQLEKLEQLRPLEAGVAIGVAVVDRTEAGIDTLEDVARVEKQLRGAIESPHVGSALK
jgi:3-deoxy-manno-octulosonate cytidylyltransferase (CMP-KDO synthetase)